MNYAFIFSVFCRAYFAVSLLNVVSELLDKPKKDAMRILGCQTLTGFIYSQVKYDSSIYNDWIIMLGHKQSFSRKALLVQLLTVTF